MSLPLPPIALSALKLLQEVITLAVFYMRAPLRLDYPWAGLCLLGAVYFAFRGGVSA